MAARWFPKSDLPFSREEAHRFLPWIIALMVSLAGLFLLAGLTLNMALGERVVHYRYALSVQIPWQAEGMDQLVTRATEALRNTPGIAKVEVTGREESARLLSPWLGNTALLDALPLPVLLDVALRPPGSGPALRTEAVQKLMQRVHPDIRVDDHERWIASYIRFTTMVQRIAYGMAALVVIASAAIITLSALTSLKLHARTVELLHGFGAHDRYIARQFQLNAFLLAVKGALLGAGLAGLVYALLVALASQLEAPLLPKIEFTPVHFAVLAFLPLATGLVALTAARATVLAMLRRIY